MVARDLPRAEITLLDLEDVGEIGVDQHLQLEAERFTPVVDHCQPLEPDLVDRTLPDHRVGRLVVRREGRRSEEELRREMLGLAERQQVAARAVDPQLPA